MGAPKRRKARATTRSPKPSEQRSKSLDQTEPDASSRLGEAIRHLRKEDRLYSRAVRTILQEARRARKQGHPVEATMLDRIATLLSTPVRTVDEFAHNANLAGKLMSWLPLAGELKDLSPNERKAWAILFIQKQGFDRKTQERLTREATQRPGRPVETRTVAVRALELHRRGYPWKKIERRLLPHRKAVANPGQSIRREVQLLKRALKPCGVRLEDL